jgi:hypothetical protein
LALGFAIPLLSKRKARKIWFEWIGRTGLDVFTTEFLLACFQNKFITEATFRFAVNTAMAKEKCTPDALQMLFQATLENVIRYHIYRSFLSVYCNKIGLNIKQLEQFQLMIATRYSCRLKIVRSENDPANSIIYFEGSRNNQETCKWVYNELVADIVTRIFL